MGAKGSRSVAYEQAVSKMPQSLLASIEHTFKEIISSQTCKSPSSPQHPHVTADGLANFLHLPESVASSIIFCANTLVARGLPPNKTFTVQGDHMMQEAFVTLVADLVQGTWSERCYVYFMACTSKEQVVGCAPLKEAMQAIWFAADAHLGGNHRPSEMRDAFCGMIASGMCGDRPTINTDNFTSYIQRNPCVERIFMAAFYPITPDVAMPTFGLYPPISTPSEFLTPEARLFLDGCLPPESRGQWELLFNSRTDGRSFSTMRGRFNCAGSTVMIIRDKDNHVFGGFAHESWELKPTFYGSEKNFLFSLLPTPGIFPASGLNKNLQYYNVNMETLPNGIGFGGQFNYFGLWISDSFDKGHSKAHPTCSTYKSPRLSKQEEFDLDVVELWRVGAKPEPKPVKREESILDKNKEESAFLEMAGKKSYSAGLREPLKGEGEEKIAQEK